MAIWNQTVRNEYLTFLKQLVGMLSPSTMGNYYPILHTTIGLHSGIDITGKFYTDDSSENGKLSYVTVLRDANSVDPSNGMGFAWMKGDGTKYNVYLVDNSPLANDLFITESFIVQSQGDNAWRAAKALEILPSTYYKFRLSISVNYEMSVTIWPATSNEPSTPTVHIGAPVAGPSASGSEFGISVMGTENCIWYYDDIEITTSAGVHTAILFKMKADTPDFPESTQATFNFYGWGSDYASSPNYGISLFIWNNDTGAWEVAGTNTSTNSTDRELTKIAHNFYPTANEYRDDSNFVHFLATSTESELSVTEVNPYYVNLQTTVPSGVHTGGCADIYINDPDKIVIAENSYTIPADRIDLSITNGFYLPIHSIVEVQISLLGDNLIRNQDWSYVSLTPEKAYSTQDLAYLDFSGAYSNLMVNVVYRYWQSGTDVQTLLDSDDYRYHGTSNLAKIMPPIIVQIDNLGYRGTFNTTAAKVALKEYINNCTISVTKSDIYNVLYGLGATYIDIANTSISIIEYDYLHLQHDAIELTDSYTKPDLSAFFADDRSLSGVIKL
jgi:hypothetical protein